MCQVLPSYFNNLSSKCYYFDKHEKFTQYLVTEQYCVARHNDFCPIENCKSHIILISDSLEDILEKLDIFFYTYQTVDCLYTLFKHQFYNTVVIRKGNVFNQLVTAIKHNNDLKCVEKIYCQEKTREKEVQTTFSEIWAAKCINTDSWICFYGQSTFYQKLYI